MASGSAAAPAPGVDAEIEVLEERNLYPESDNEESGEDFRELPELDEEDDETPQKRSRLECYSSDSTHQSNGGQLGLRQFSRKFQGAAVYKSKFQRDWQKKWPCVTPVKDRPHHFYCTPCSKAVSCGHQGEKDVKRHMDSAMHKKNVISLAHTSPLVLMPAGLKRKV